MNPCTEHEALLAARSAGELDAAGAARLDAHLAGCERCRTELEETARALSLAALPPPGDAERAALSGLAGSTLAAYRGLERGRPTRAWALGMAAIAAAAMAVVAPAVFRRAPAPPAGQQETVAQAEAAWEPDLDELWDVTELIDWGQ